MNTELYEKTDVEKQSSIVKKIRLSWLSHPLRLDEETLEKKALAEHLHKVKKKCGRRKTCWIDIIKGDFQYLNINDKTKLLQHIKFLSGDRELWKTLTQHMMLNTTVMQKKKEEGHQNFLSTQDTHTVFTQREGKGVNV